MSGNLYRKLVKIAKNNPKVRKDLIPVLLKYSEESESPSPTFEEEIKEETTVHPETGNVVKIVTLRNAPEGSKARNKYEQIKSDWHKSKQEGDSKKDQPLREDQIEEKNSKLKALSGKALEVSKKEITESLKSNSSKIKNILKDVKEGLKGEGGFKELGEMVGILFVMIFDSKEGMRLLEEVMEDLKVKNSSEVVTAISELKAAEIRAISEEYRVELLKATGLDPENPKVDKEKIKEWLDGDLEDLPYYIIDELLVYLEVIDEDRLRFLARFVKDGKLDVQELRRILKKGTFVEEELDKEDGDRGEGVKKPEEGSGRNLTIYTEKDREMDEKEKALEKAQRKYSREVVVDRVFKKYLFMNLEEADRHHSQVLDILKRPEENPMTPLIIDHRKK